MSPEGVPVADYACSPDGRTLAVLEGRVPRRDQDRKPGRLWLIDTTTSEARMRAEPPPNEGPRGRLSWSPDGRHLAWEVAVSLDDRRDSQWEVRLVAIAKGPIRQVVPVGACQTVQPVWRPDGQALAFAATPHPYGYNALYSLATWNLRGGMARYRTRDPMMLKPIIPVAAWAPDSQTIYISARQASITEHLYAVSMRDGSLRQLTYGLANHKAPVVSSDGRWLACEVEAPDRLAEVWLVATDGSEARPLTEANRRLDPIDGLGLLESALVRWRSKDGQEIEGLLLYPPGYGPDHPPPDPLPTIVDLHGGPLHVTPRRRLGDDPLHFSGLHYLAAHGYLCFSADYRSSGVYGWQHIQRMIDDGHDMNVRLDAADIMTGVDCLVMEGLADPARLGLRGHSWGAFLVNWLVTQTSRFAAAVSAEGVADHAAAVAATAPNTIAEVGFGGAPEEVPENYRDASPLTYAAQARTPILLIEGAKRLPVETTQGEAFRDALAAAGVEVEYVQYAGEGHTLAQPSNQADYLRRMLAWLDRHLTGRDVPVS